MRIVIDITEDGYEYEFQENDELITDGICPSFEELCEVMGEVLEEIDDQLI